MADDFRQRIEALREGVLEAVVHRADGFRSDLRGGEVGRSFQADRKRMQARPPGFGEIVVLDAMAREARSAGGDER